MMTGPAGLALDWITIWQSELSAAATDRERGEAWSTLVAYGADMARLLQGWADGPPGSAAAASPARAAAADAAPDARDTTFEQLARRVAELERQLAGHRSSPA